MNKNEMNLILTNDLQVAYPDYEDFKAYVVDNELTDLTYDELTDEDLWEIFDNYVDLEYDCLLEGVTDINMEQRVTINGTLGLWDGDHKIQPVKNIKLKDAIRKCLNDMDYYAIYASKDNTSFYIEAAHHDGDNRFEITPYQEGDED